jgi:hypothetical protein
VIFPAPEASEVGKATSRLHFLLSFADGIAAADSGAEMSFKVETKFGAYETLTPIGPVAGILRI